MIVGSQAQKQIRKATNYKIGRTKEAHSIGRPMPLSLVAPEVANKALTHLGLVSLVAPRPYAPGGGVAPEGGFAPSGGVGSWGNKTDKAKMGQGLDPSLASLGGNKAERHESSNAVNLTGPSSLVIV